MGGKPRMSPSTTGNPHWCTPGWLLECARDFAGGEIALDPCGNARSVVGAAVEWWGPHSTALANRIDGLARRWVVADSAISARIATAWVNPVYTRGLIDLWVAKCREEGRWGPLEVLAILPGRPSSAWFKVHCFPPDATGICFLDRRVKFLGAGHGVPWESVVVHWGRLGLLFEDVFSKVGKVWLR